MHKSMFTPGERCFFTTDSNLYQDTYEVQVMRTHPDHIDLHLCYSRGYLTLPPVGTRINWIESHFQSINSFSTIIHRSLPDKMWSVTVPQTSAQSVRTTRVLAVGSGKGGTGKTTFSINLAMALASIKKRAILLDADIGMANIGILLGLQSSYNLNHVIDGECTLAEIVLEGPSGVGILPGASSISALNTLNPLQFNRITSGFSTLEQAYDLLLIDTGAGISELVIKFLESADDFLLLTNPEPHALLDAYSLCKILYMRNPNIQIHLIINRCESEKEAKICKDTFIRAVNQFLHIDPVYLGWLPYDKLIPRSTRDRNPMFLTHPHTRYSKNLLRIASNLLGTAEPDNRTSSFENFLKKLGKNF